MPVTAGARLLTADAWTMSRESTPNDAHTGGPAHHNNTTCTVTMPTSADRRQQHRSTNINCRIQKPTGCMYAMYAISCTFIMYALTDDRLAVQKM